MTDERRKLITPVLCTIENDDIKEFALKVLDDLPEYIWSVPASSTGKYHPAYSLGEGGLMRHQIAVVRFLNFFFELEQYSSKLTSREMDLMRVAALVHDGMKSGTMEQFAASKYTKFEHPILMANKIREYKGELPDEELELIAEAISKHMGAWNTDKKSDLVLPKPNDKFSRMLHVADYLASRKSLTVDFENYVAATVSEIPDLQTFIVPFGTKHKGELLIDVAKNDPSYISWMRENVRREPFISLIKQIDKLKEGEDKTE